MFWLHYPTESKPLSAIMLKNIRAMRKRKFGVSGKVKTTLQAIAQAASMPGDA
jgi:hypothetical protein